MLENVRLDAAEKNALMYAIKDISDEVYLLGSRLDNYKRGGDIDLLIFSKQNSLNLSLQVTRNFFIKCEEKIDVLVLDKDNLSKVEKAFIKTLKLVKIN